MDLEQFFDSLKNRFASALGRSSRASASSGNEPAFTRARYLMQLHLLLLMGPVLFLALLTGLERWENYIMASGLTYPFVAGRVEIEHLLLSLLKFMLYTTAIAGSGLGLLWLASVCRPGALELSAAGLRLLLPSLPSFMQPKVMPWSSITRVTLDQPPKSPLPSDARLTFWLSNGRRIRLRVGSFPSPAAREEILRAIERWAPGLKRDPEVIAALQPPPNYGYTELWLQALTAPPERDKLQPLCQGASLQNGQFHVIADIGAGGQGMAYLARDCLSEETVVLKEFVLPLYVDINVRKSALEQFEREARLLKELSHPQIVALRDFFVEDHRAYLVLEHIDGQSLRTLVEKEGALDEQHVIKLALQMCDIVEYLHSRTPPVVHRDFSPDNLILRSDGTLKLIDFNVAQQTDVTVTGTTVGKPSYLPPEQFRGEASTLSDIYAMGATLHYLLTASDPVPLSTSHPAEQAGSISLELDELIAEATAPDATLRLPSIQQFKRRLSPLQEQQVDD